jgi:hypothetical protein
MSELAAGCRQLAKGYPAPRWRPLATKDVVPAWLLLRDCLMSAAQRVSLVGDDVLASNEVILGLRCYTVQYIFLAVLIL